MSSSRERARRSCGEIERLLAAYVDSTASPAECAAVETHAGCCPPCDRRIRCERTARAVLVARRAALRGCASGGLHARCAAAQAMAAASSRSGWLRRPWVPLSVAATLVLAIAGFLLFGLNDSVEALTTQLAVDHVKCFKWSGGGPPVEAASLERRWSDAHGWTLAVPPSVPGMRLELHDVRRCLTTGGKVAHVMYQWAGQPLSVFVLPQVVRGAGEVRRLVRRFGQGAVVWSERGRTYVVMARQQPDDLDAVVSYVRARVQ